MCSILQRSRVVAWASLVPDVSALTTVAATFIACSPQLQGDAVRADAGADLDVGTSVDGGREASAQDRASLADRPDEHTALVAMTFHDECDETRADVCDDCEADALERESECWSACHDAVIYGGPVLSCVDLCGDISSNNTCLSECTGKPDACLRRVYRFEVTLGQDTAVLDACNAAVARDADCDESWIGTDCDLYARVERHEVATAYSCLSGLKCGADPATCFEQLGVSELAREVAKWCPEEELDDETTLWLEVSGQWTRPEVQQDLQACKGLCGSGDFETCVDAWCYAVIGG